MDDDINLSITVNPTCSNELLTRPDFTERIFTRALTPPTRAFLTEVLHTFCIPDVESNICLTQLRAILAQDDKHLIRGYQAQYAGDAFLLCKDLARLNPGIWINDEVVNCYSAILDHATLPHTAIFSTFFFNSLVDRSFKKKKNRWRRIMVTRFRLRKDADLCVPQQDEYGSIIDMIIFAIHEGKDHWAAGCIELKNQQISYFNSLNQHKFGEFKNVRFFMRTGLIE